MNNNSYVAIDDDDEKMRSLNDGATTPLTLTSGLTQTDAQREAAATAPLNTIGNAGIGFTFCTP